MKPIPYFFLIACLFSWIVWIPLALSRSGLIPVQLPMPLYFLGAFGPMIGALICSKKYSISSPKQLFKQLFTFKTGIQWYLAALLLPFFLYAISASLVYFLYPNESFQFNAPLGVVTALFSMLFIVVGEELGWRGFALPFLQTKYTALKSSFYVGLMWGIWHFPAFFVSGIFDSTALLLLSFLGFMILIIAFSIIFTWVHNSSGGITFLAVLLHAAVAGASGMTNIAIKQPVPFFLFFTIAFLIAAGIILWRYGGENLSSKARVKLQ
jgi:membrane protease YdiL (CAAX protease family)